MTQQQGLTKEAILDLLKDENYEEAERFAAYCIRLLIEKKDGKLKNPWMQTKKAKDLAQLFKRVKGEGLVFDGKHITLQNTGISYDYVAYKNKMLLVYPESVLDHGIVMEGDEFTTGNESGKVVYKHVIKDPFANLTDQNFKGAFFFVRNKRGEHLTILTKEEIAKHRRAAKTDMMWKAWFKEMVLKTVIKKGVKYHYDDIFTGIEQEDNKQYDLEKVIQIEEDPAADARRDEVLNTLAAFKELAPLQEYYKALEPALIKDPEVVKVYNEKKNSCSPTKATAS